MAELADAIDSGSIERKFMEVQVLLSAPFLGKDTVNGSIFSFFILRRVNHS